jgi:acyl-CoA reductase-like NAD-dependent aldehyde dehydrogenase
MTASGKKQETLSPRDNSICTTRILATEFEAFAALERAKEAQRRWAQTSIQERVQILERMVDCMKSIKDDVAREISIQMGR